MENTSGENSFRVNDLFEKEVKILSGKDSDHHVKLGGLGNIANLNREIITKIEKSIGLLFLEKMEDGNVCFANNNDDLRDEFKQVFSPGDVLDYIYGVLNSPQYNNKELRNPEIPYPENAEAFWHSVESGRKAGYV